MESLFHLYIKASGSDRWTTRAVFEEAEASEDNIRFDQSDAYKNANKQLVERTPALALPTLDAQHQVCATIGSHLFDTFFTGSVLRLFRTYRAANTQPRIALHLPRFLYRQPWELLKDPEDALAGEFISRVGSIIRFDGDANGNDPLTTFLPPLASLKCLFLAARPSPTREFEDVPPFEPESSSRLVFDVVTPGTYSNLISAADTPGQHGFVFYGHGTVKEKMGHLVFVVMQLRGLSRYPVGDPRTGAAVTTALAAAKLRFGCVMACETAWVDDENVRFEDTVAGSLLTKTRIAFVVGTQLKINFVAASEFITQTLNAAQNGLPLDLATRHGRLHVLGLADEGNKRANFDWWVPVLYAKSVSLELVARPSLPLPALTRTY